MIHSSFSIMRISKTISGLFILPFVLGTSFCIGQRSDAYLSFVVKGNLSYLQHLPDTSIHYFECSAKELHLAAG